MKCGEAHYPTCSILVTNTLWLTSVSHCLLLRKKSRLLPASIMMGKCSVCPVGESAHKWNFPLCPVPCLYTFMVQGRWLYLPSDSSVVPQTHRNWDAWQWSICGSLCFIYLTWVSGRHVSNPRFHSHGADHRHLHRMPLALMYSSPITSIEN